MIARLLPAAFYITGSLCFIVGTVLGVLKDLFQ